MPILLLLLAVVSVFVMRNSTLALFAGLVIATVVFRGFFYSYSDADAAILIIAIITCTGVFVYGAVTGVKRLIRRFWS